VVVIATAIVYYLLQRKETNKPVANNPTQFLQRDTITIRNLNPVVRAPQQQPASPAKDLPSESSVEYNGKPIEPTRLDIILQAAAAFGLGLGGILYYIIFYERRRRMEAKKREQETDENYDAAREKNNNGPEQWAHSVLKFPQ